MPLCKQIPDTVDSLRKSLDDQKKLKDASVASQYNGILGIPIIDQLLNDTTSLLSSMLSDVTAASVSYITSSLKSKVDVPFGVAEGLVGMVGLINLGSMGSAVVAALIAQQLQKQLALRILYYQELLYHYQALQATLVTLKNTASPKQNNLRVKASRFHVQKAHIAALRLQSKLQNLGVWDSRYHNIIFDEIASAEKYLTKNKELDNDYLRSLKLNEKKSYERLWKYLQRRFNQEVLGKTLHVVDSLFWHSEQIAFILPLPFKQLLSPKGITAGLEKRFPGYVSTTFNPTTESQKYDVFVEKIKTEHRFLQEVNSGDFLKGIILTNLSVDGYLKTLPNIPSLWDGLLTSAAGLQDMISPVPDILNEVSDSMNSSIAKNDNDITLTFKIPMWVAELESAKQYQDTFAKAGELQEDVYWNKIYLQALIDYINNSHFVDNDIPPLIIKSFRAIFLAPVNSLWLNESLVEIQVLINKIHNAMGTNFKLNSLCQQTISKTSNTIQDAMLSFENFSTTLSKIPGPAGALGTQLLNGDIANATAAIATLLSTGAAVGAVILDATSGCESESTNYSSVMNQQSDIWWKNETTIKSTKIGILTDQ